VQPESDGTRHAGLKLAAEFDRRRSAVTAVRVGGAAVMVAEGILTL